ncbi:c-type cytochrome [Campylobacter sp. TTU-622]|uniref:c-type cytochrome n=1 Tax=unclassified Campylobacter TaxID=2593542 RepID=UPI001903FF2E|nr:MULTISPECIES: c-type cytochrome [unclassified Campylobacter]MBK1971860.1 c-type cytochrome [Campylobacter sp. TTU_617]MBK1973840.1 c-type cytochrome [Campylobacter sp. TTU-622]
MQWLNLEDNINLLSLIGAILIILITLIVVNRIFKQIKEKKKEDLELSEHSWDDIKEYKNNIPIGWLVVYVLTIVWGIWYFLWGYPLNLYSRIGEYNEEVALHNAKFEEKFKNLSEQDRITMGENIFLVQCAACHGITADGMNGKAQNLNIWGSEEGIVETIKTGSKGMNFSGGEMPAASDLGIEDEDIKAIAAYVAKELSAIKKTSNEDLVAKGKEAYASCAACHGEDGKGQDGAFPDLTKYGSASFVVDVLNSGKKGFIGSMPSFPSLNDIQKQAVGEYVISLSRGE